MERLLCDLKIIASQRAGDRIYQDKGTLQIMHPSLVGSLWRSVRGDSRGASVSAVTACLSEALLLADEHTLSWERAAQPHQLQKGGGGADPAAERLKERALHLVGEIDGASAGLRHMRLTYAEDLTVCAKLGVLSERVATRLAILREILGVARQRSPSLGHLQLPFGAESLVVLSLPDPSRYV